MKNFIKDQVVSLKIKNVIKHGKVMEQKNDKVKVQLIDDNDLSIGLPNWFTTAELNPHVKSRKNAKK